MVALEAEEALAEALVLEPSSNDLVCRDQQFVGQLEGEEWDSRWPYYFFVALFFFSFLSWPTFDKVFLADAFFFAGMHRRTVFGPMVGSSDSHITLWVSSGEAAVAAAVAKHFLSLVSPEWLH